jgi:hypothetical protein
MDATTYSADVHEESSAGLESQIREDGNTDIEESQNVDTEVLEFDDDLSPEGDEHVNRCLCVDGSICRRE